MSQKIIIFDYQGVLNTGADITDVILKLSKKYQLFIASNSSLSNIKGFLDNLGILKYFTEIIGYQANLSKFDKFNNIFENYSIDSKNVIFITDTSGDIFQAKEAKIGSIIAILGGWEDRKALLRANPDILVDNFQELSTKIKTLYK